MGFSDSPEEMYRGDVEMNKFYGKKKFKGENSSHKN